jgi:hypothetical protein
MENCSERLESWLLLLTTRDQVDDARIFVEELKVRVDDGKLFGVVAVLVALEVIFVGAEKLKVAEVIDIQHNRHVIVGVLAELEASDETRCRWQLQVVIRYFDHIDFVRCRLGAGGDFRSLGGLDEIVGRFLLLLVGHVVGDLRQRLASSMVDLVTADGVLEEIWVVGEVSGAVFALEVDPKLGEDQTKSFINSLCMVGDCRGCLRAASTWTTTGIPSGRLNT